MARLSRAWRRRRTDAARPSDRRAPGVGSQLPSRRKVGLRFPTGAHAWLNCAMTESPMPHPPAAWPEAEPRDHTRWTHEKAARFLKLLARSDKVAPSARAVGMSRQSAYVLRARAPTFASLWDHAMAEARKQRSMRSRARRRSPCCRRTCTISPCRRWTPSGTRRQATGRAGMTLRWSKDDMGRAPR